ncbi:MAG: M50 family metallopeptidase [Kiritimatiellae bacterium]|nr:M50 family metallopeptidase [Kiritimatiellia bacterium]
MLKIFRAILGILLLPICIVITISIADIIKALEPSATLTDMPIALALLAGFLLWILIYYLLPRPVRTYIIAHELTHALWATVMGADVFDMKIDKDHGSVTLSENNFLITLAPYFFPLYTVITIIIYYICSIFFDVEQYTLIWLGLVGLTWGFHFTFTLGTLMQHQTDIQLYGYIFSYTFIYILNALGIGLWIVLVSSTTLEDMLITIGSNFIEVIAYLHNAVSTLIETIPER